MTISRFGIIFTSALLLTASAHPAHPPNPFEQTVTPLEAGDAMPQDAYIDQAGREFRFSALRGRTTLLGFIYTRCTDACPIITQKFALTRARLGAGEYHLVEATIDPARDTVPAIAAYARKYGAQSDDWSIITGTSVALTRLWRSAGVSVIDNGKGELVHNERLIIVSPDGSVADVIDAAGWSPSEVAAEMQHVAGRASNPIARADLALTKVVAQFCGGSYRTASGLIDAAMGLLLLGAGAAIFYWFGRRVFVQGA
ncbi:MAG TPA: SCO family protein [Candidatus Eremiobacteraceae bacterium]|nr:SCO family protein [Candidatus Eremiobacteraceae bacterium]